MALAIAVALSGCVRRSTIPYALTDREFASLIEAVSEPAGTFTLSDNLVSNEPRFAENARWLGPRRGVYIGVGPEQNFSYIARLRPPMAFVVDIRRENRTLHFLYKALFELSTDRVDFVARLFSRPRPAGLTREASVSEIFRRFEEASPSLDEYNRNVTLIHDRLLNTRRLPAALVDLEGINRALHAFYTDGPAIDFWRGRRADGARPSYRQLMTMPDYAGQERSFLASEEGFQFVKDLHTRNAIVPVIGDFGGPTALRRIGEYVRNHNDAIAAFYGSNVSVYLTNRQMHAFCDSLAALPAARGARFIDSDTVTALSTKVRDCAARAK